MNKKHFDTYEAAKEYRDQQGNPKNYKIRRRRSGFGVTERIKGWLERNE